MPTNQDKSRNATVVSMIGNLLLAVLKWITGYFGHSYALIADAIESTSDVFASFLVMLGLRYANKPPDKNHPYGHGRIEPLVTFLVVGFLIASALVIAHQSISNIQHPHESPEPYTLIVLAVIIILKELFYRYVKKKSSETGSLTLRADAWHHRSDAITSGAAFVGISIALWMGPGYEQADDWAALVAAVIIVFNSYRIFRPALGELMDEHVYDELVEKIRTVSLQTKGVLGTEKCLIRKNGISFLVDLHVIVDGSLTVRAGHETAHRLKDKLMVTIPTIGDVLVHIEPEEL